MLGSMFTLAAEENYSPTDGEMLAVSDALHNTKNFSLGLFQAAGGFGRQFTIGTAVKQATGYH